MIGLLGSAACGVVAALFADWFFRWREERHGVTCSHCGAHFPEGCVTDIKCNCCPGFTSAQTSRATEEHGGIGSPKE